jgi:hypothetical protein
MESCFVVPSLGHFFYSPVDDPAGCVPQSPVGGRWLGCESVRRHCFSVKCVFYLLPGHFDLLNRGSTRFLRRRQQNPENLSGVPSSRPCSGLAAVRQAAWWPLRASPIGRSMTSKYCGLRLSAGALPSRRQAPALSVPPASGVVVTYLRWQLREGWRSAPPACPRRGRLRSHRRSRRRRPCSNRHYPGSGRCQRRC